MGWLVFGGDFDGRMSGKLGVALQDHWFAACGLDTLDELFLKLSQTQGRSFRPASRRQSGILPASAMTR